MGHSGKRFLECDQANQSGLRLLKSAQVAVEYSAKLLGRVTFASNHTFKRMNGEGNLVNHNLGDSVEVARCYRDTAGTRPEQTSKSASRPSAGREVRPWEPHSSATAKPPAGPPARQKQKRDAHWHGE